MAIDMAIRDNASPSPNRQLLNVSSWTRSLGRAPKQHERKTTPGVGAKQERLTDHGASKTQWTFHVTFESWALYKAAYNNFKTTFFANRPWYLELFYNTGDEEEYEGAVLAFTTDAVRTDTGGETKIDATIVFQEGSTFSLLG